MFLSLFEETFGSPPQYLARAPGRVNLLGEHVDYNDGPVLPCAIDRHVQIAARAARSESASTRIVKLYAIDYEERVSFDLDRLTAKIDINGNVLPDWALYPAGVANALQDAGLAISGMDALYTSNIPVGAGLSSSAAIEVGFATLWLSIAGINIEPLSLAQLCQRAENNYVGVACGLMDQFASASGVENHVLYFDTRSLEWEAIPFPSNTAIVIADSGIRRSLTTSAYNERRNACEQALSLLRNYLPEIHSLRDVQTTEFMAYSSYLPPEVSIRAEHVVKEIARVQSARSALLRSDLKTFGALMFSGHKSLRDLYQVSTPELDKLVELARNLPGCYGARLTGAGFGGCTVNLLDIAGADPNGLTGAESFVTRLKTGYHDATQRDVQVYLCHASQGATCQRL